jgi:amino acid transporter
MVGSSKTDNRKRDLLVAFGAGGIYFALRMLIQDERAFLIALSAFLFYAVIASRWDNRRDKWFWIAVLVFAAIHVVVLATLRLPRFEGPSLAIAAPFMFADGFAMWGLLNWIERHVSKRSS